VCTNWWQNITDRTVFDTRVDAATASNRRLRWLACQVQSTHNDSQHQSLQYIQHIHYAKFNSLHYKVLAVFSPIPNFQLHVTTNFSFGYYYTVVYNQTPITFSSNFSQTWFNVNDCSSRNNQKFYYLQVHF